MHVWPACCMYSVVGWKNERSHAARRISLHPSQIGLWVAICTAALYCYFSAGCMWCEKEGSFNSRGAAPVFHALVASLSVTARPVTRDRLCCAGRSASSLPPVT